MSLKTSSVIFINGYIVSKFPNNEIRIKPLKWLKEEDKVIVPETLITERDKSGRDKSGRDKPDDDDNILQKLASGKVTFDDIVYKYF
jgi:hypothetical protein